jgi:hypothetical protein
VSKLKKLSFSANGDPNDGSLVHHPYLQPSQPKFSIKKGKRKGKREKRKGKREKNGKSGEKKQRKSSQKEGEKDK